MIRLKAGYKPLLWMLAIPALNIFYVLLNNESGTVYNLAMPWDDRTPFWPLFIVPYLLWYPYVIGMLVLFCFRKRRVYYRTLLAICLGLVMSYLVYFFFQTTVPRPELSDRGLLHSLVAFVYATDAPFNCFPSIHVLTSYLVMKGMTDWRSPAGINHIAVQFMSWSIIASTLFVKQHVILDVAGAILLAEFVFFMAGRWLRSKDQPEPMTLAADRYGASGFGNATMKEE
ncbi:phosphatase PAP2 family protein [Paenibacillus sp. GCM10027626]|uniref:phosphatase PAP2 family protein n=1 Tax=Paenibacillus sp. GCM10027626 TaxID=3273411 RepID=UPI00362E99D0